VEGEKRAQEFYERQRLSGQIGAPAPMSTEIT